MNKPGLLARAYAGRERVTLLVSVDVESWIDRQEVIDAVAGAVKKLSSLGVDKKTIEVEEMEVCE